MEKSTKNNKTYEKINEKMAYTIMETNDKTTEIISNTVTDNDTSQSVDENIKIENKENKNFEKNNIFMSNNKFDNNMNLNSKYEVETINYNIIPLQEKNKISNEFDSDEDSNVDDINNKNKYDNNKLIYNSEWDEEFFHHQTNNNDNIPIDLSNDIKINEILANQETQINPDAEIFSIEQQQHYIKSSEYSNHPDRPIKK